MSCGNDCGAIYIASAYTAEVTLADPAGAAIATATVTAQLFDALGQAVGSPVACPHVANGVYRGAMGVDVTSGLVEGRLYIVRYIAVNLATFEETLVAQRRRA